MKIKHINSYVSRPLTNGAILLKKVGSIFGTTHSGELLVRVNKPPRLFQQVLDMHKKKLGKVVHIFGNIRNPFILVKPNKKTDHLRMVGRDIYKR